MRALPFIFLAVVLASLPMAVAQSDHVLPAGSYLQFPVEADGQSFSIDVVADAPIDIILVRGGDAQDYYAGNATQAWAVFNNTEAHVSLRLAAGEQLWLLLDNSAQPAGGAPGELEANASVAIMVEMVVVTPPTVDAPEHNTLWRSLMFTAPFWEVGAIGVAGIALWLLLACAGAAYGFKASVDKLGVLVAGVATLAFLWALLPHPGMVSQVGMPMLIGAGAGYLASQGAKTMPQAVRLALLGGFLGALAGLVVGHLVQSLWADNGMLVIGGERFLDGLFIIPATAVFATLLLKVIPAFVEALEDEETAAPASSTQQGATFSVNCLRCGTAITVNRAMKRYRVATDRFEFPCPNCNAWMEWAEPKPPAAA